MERQNEAALRVVERIGVRATPEEAETFLREWNEQGPRAFSAARSVATPASKRVPKRVPKRVKPIKKSAATPDPSWRRKSA